MLLHSGAAATPPHESSRKCRPSPAHQPCALPPQPLADLPQLNRNTNQPGDGKRVNCSQLTGYSTCTCPLLCGASSVRLLCLIAKPAIPRLLSQHTYPAGGRLRPHAHRVPSSRAPPALPPLLAPLSALHCSCSPILCQRISSRCRCDSAPHVCLSPPPSPAAPPPLQAHEGVGLSGRATCVLAHTLVC